jgi:hypothetical protein
VTFQGRCDGSAAASVAGKYLVTTSDEVDDETEENTLALYDPVRGGKPVAIFPLNDALGLPKNGKKSAKEADLESATVLTVGSTGSPRTPFPKTARSDRHGISSSRPKRKGTTGCYAFPANLTIC